MQTGRHTATGQSLVVDGEEDGITVPRRDEASGRKPTGRQHSGPRGRPAERGCHDGNLNNLDGCSDTCEPEIPIDEGV